MKTCTDCGEHKPNSAFYKSKHNTGTGLASHCKVCTIKRTVAYGRGDKGKEKQRRYQLKRFYGITLEQYDELLQQQNGCCAICGRSADSFSKRLAVDHDHFTGEIRGLICDFDNRFLIGRLRRGNGGDVLLTNAGEYLRKEGTGWIVPSTKSKKRSRKRKAGTGLDTGKSSSFAGGTTKKRNTSRGK